jgi:hypothetical protein
MSRATARSKQDEQTRRLKDNAMNYLQHNVENGVPIKMWTKGVPVEDEARKQLENAARLPAPATSCPLCAGPCDRRRRSTTADND